MRYIYFFALLQFFALALHAQADQIKTLRIPQAQALCDNYTASPMRLVQGARINTSGALSENFWSSPLSEGKVISLKTLENLVLNGENLVRKGTLVTAQVKKITYYDRGLKRGEIAEVLIEVVKLVACDCSNVKLDGEQKLTPGTQEISILSRVSESKNINTSR